MCLIIIILIQIIASSLGNDEYITVLNINPMNNSGQIFQCYTPSTLTGYRLSYGRSFNISGADKTSETLWNRRNEHWYATEEWNMGVYYCKIVIGDKTTIVQTTKIRRDAEIKPTNSKNSVTVNIGDDVTISFDVADPDWDVYWRKDDELLSDETTKVKSMTFHTVKITNAGMYEVYREGQRSARKHSFINLIVRACPRHKWGPPECIGDCYCYNGGICDENSGICICAPGFKGTTCNIECGGNKHGWKCEWHCTVHDRIDACMKKQFCLPDPYGCSCVTGFKGLDCATQCEAGKYGANCVQSCHCNQGGCDRFTGTCTDTEDSSCAHPWTGSNCQECQQPYYGENCEFKCTKSCECHRITGDCIGGKCYTNAWIEPHCEIGILNTTFSSVNNGQNTDVYCTVYDGGVDNVKPLVMVTNNNNITENITASMSKEDGQNIRTYKFPVVSDINSTYKCVIVHEGKLAQSDIAPNIYRLPVYNGYIKTVISTSSSITIEWTAWNSEADNGDGPITGYYLYYKMNNSNDWENQQHQKGLKTTVTGLLQDTTYTFALSAVRPGEGGEGPEGKQWLTTSTLCGLCDIFSTTVIAGFGAGFGLMVFIDIIIFVVYKQRKRKKTNKNKSTDSVYQATTVSKEDQYDGLNLYENTREPTDGATKSSSTDYYENNSVILNTTKGNPGVVASNEEQYDELNNKSGSQHYECVM